MFFIHKKYISENGNNTYCFDSRAHKHGLDISENGNNTYCFDSRAHKPVCMT